MAFVPLVHRSQLHEGYFQALSVKGHSLLLIQHGGETFVIENKCGHFGVPLATGRVADGKIRCSQHGFEFELRSGRLVSRPFEHCDPLVTFAVQIQGEFVGVEL